MALQEAALLELHHRPATASPGSPARAAWQLLSAGEDLSLWERDAEAAAEGPHTQGSGTAAAQPAERGTAAVGGLLQPAGAAETPAAEQEAAALLQLPFHLAVQWQQGGNAPPLWALPFLRPGATAMLRALQVRSLGQTVGSCSRSDALTCCACCCTASGLSLVVVPTNAARHVSHMSPCRPSNRPSTGLTWRGAAHARPR